MRIAPYVCALALLVSTLVIPARSAEWSFLPAVDGSPQEESLVSTAWEEEELVDFGPRWTAWAGAIFLNRSAPSNQTLIRGAGGGVELLNANDMNFGTAAGVDLNALRHGEVFDVDFRYFQVDNMTAQRGFSLFGPIELPFSNPLDFSAPRIDTLYTSSIQSVELNLRKNVRPRLALLAGFRYLAFDDNLGQKFDIFGDSLSLYNVQVAGLNRLYGAQIGADAVVFSAGRFQVESAIKAGIYGNDARNSLRVSVLELPTTTIGRRTSQTAFVGDWNFSGVWQFTDHWALRGGYQLLWVSGVALSSDQYPVTFPNPIPDLDVISSGDVFLHGALVSVQATW